MSCKIRSTMSRYDDYNWPFPPSDWQNWMYLSSASLNDLDCSTALRLCSLILIRRSSKTSASSSRLKGWAWCLFHFLNADHLIRPSAPEISLWTRSPRLLCLPCSTGICKGHWLLSKHHKVQRFQGDFPQHQKKLRTTWHAPMRRTILSRPATAGEEQISSPLYKMLHQSQWSQALYPPRHVPHLLSQLT